MVEVLQLAVDAERVQLVHERLEEALERGRQRVEVGEVLLCVDGAGRAEVAEAWRCGIGWFSRGRKAVAIGGRTGVGGRRGRGRGARLSGRLAVAR